MICKECGEETGTDSDICDICYEELDIETGEY